MKQFTQPHKFTGSHLSEPSPYDIQASGGCFSGCELRLHSGIRLHETRFSPAPQRKQKLHSFPDLIWMGFIRSGSIAIQLPDLGKRILKKNDWFMGRFEDICTFPTADPHVGAFAMEVSTGMMKGLLTPAKPGTPAHLSCFTCANQFKPTLFSGPSTPQLQTLSEQLQVRSASRSLHRRLELEETSLDWISELFQQPALVQSGAISFGCSLTNPRSPHS